MTHEMPAEASTTPVLRLPDNTPELIRNHAELTELRFAVKALFNEHHNHAGLFGCSCQFCRNVKKWVG